MEIHALVGEDLEVIIFLPQPSVYLKARRVIPIDKVWMFVQLHVLISLQDREI